jgi:uncharacterized protein (DUF2235 family)
MPKTIVFCADGTWNRPGTDDDADRPSYPTNVFKTFANLAGVDDVADICAADEQERTASDAQGSTLQIAKYLHGVGDSDNVLVKLLGGATGAGIIARIVRGYTFVSRNFVPGDAIVLLGFSRGAYTVRALAGLIGGRGLLDATKLNLTDKQQAYRLGAAVWYDYQHALIAGQHHADLLAQLEDTAADLPAFLSQPPTTALLSPVAIDTVAVWDTVGSLGIPEFSSSGAQADLFRFASTILGPAVRNGFHAVGRDEQRGDFTPTLWDPDPRITQLLFPGAHGDVGGGYPATGGESGLSDETLVWMTGLLAGRGVLFAAKPIFQAQANPLGVAHQPWRQLPFCLLPFHPRTFPATLAEAAAVGLRRAGGSVQADPSLPAAPYP